MGESSVGRLNSGKGFAFLSCCRARPFAPRAMRTILNFASAVGLAFVASTAFAQPPDTLWTRVYQTDYVENCMALHETQDAGFMMAGFYYDSIEIGTTQGYLRKVDRNGNEEWFRDYGGQGSEFFFDGMPTSDGGYILAGSSGDYGSAWVVKTDVNGNTKWARQEFGDPSEWRDVVGIVQTEDGGYTLAGVHDDQPGINYYLIKLRPSGETEWMRSYSEGWETRITINDFKQTFDGGYIVVGYFLRWVPPTTLPVVYVAKADNRGNLLWSWTYRHPEGYSTAYHVDVEPNGDFDVVADVVADDGTHFYLMRVDGQGEMLWDRVYDEILSDYNGFLLMPGGGYLLSATDMSRRQAVLVRMNAKGDTVWTRRYDSLPDYCFGDQICVTWDGGIGFSGSIVRITGPERDDEFLVRLEPEAGYPWPWPGGSGMAALAQNYPNPFNSSTVLTFWLSDRAQISLKVFDALGRQVTTLTNGILPCGTYHVEFDGSNLPSGVYFYRLDTAGESQTKKMILLK
jgi:hypothetical protein